MLDVQAHGGETLGAGIVGALDGVGAGDVAGVGVRVTEEVGEGDGGEGVGVVVGRRVEFHHVDDSLTVEILAMRWDLGDEV